MDYDWLGGKMENFANDGDSLDSDLHDKDNLFFEDLKDLRDLVEHNEDDNKYFVDRLETKDLRRESKISSDIKARKLARSAIGSLLTPGSLKSSGLCSDDLMKIADAPTDREYRPDRHRSTLPPMKIVPLGELATARNESPTYSRRGTLPIVPLGQLLISDPMGLKSPSSASYESI